MYDVLHDADYRRCWDDNMLECFEICQLDRYNDIGYYSSKSIHFCPDMPYSSVSTDQGGQVQALLVLLCSIPGQDTWLLHLLRYYLRLTSILSRGWAENNIDTSYYWYLMSSWYLMGLKQTSSIVLFSLSVKCPSPMRNRDFVTQRSWYWEDDNFIIFNHTVHHKVRRTNSCTY